MDELIQPEINNDIGQLESFSFFDKSEICTVSKDPESSGLEALTDDMLVLKHRRKISAVIERISEIGLPAPGEQLRLVTRRNFNAIEILEHLCKQDRVTDLKMAIYSINFDAGLILIDLIKSGKIDRAQILMSNLRNGSHRVKEAVLKDLFQSNQKISLFYCSSHAKTMSCAMESGNYYSVEGSGNHGYNSRVEQYVIDNCEQLYEFHCVWMEKIRKYVENKKEYSQ